MSWLWLTFKILKVHDIVGGDSDNLLFLRTMDASASFPNSRQLRGSAFGLVVHADKNPPSRKSLSRLSKLHIWDESLALDRDKWKKIVGEAKA
jgi:hypothetical protein